jgi:hypothetical protein
METHPHDSISHVKRERLESFKNRRQKKLWVIPNLWKKIAFTPGLFASKNIKINCAALRISGIMERMSDYVSVGEVDLTTVSCGEGLFVRSPNNSAADIKVCGTEDWELNVFQVRRAGVNEKSNLKLTNIFSTAPDELGSVWMDLIFKTTEAIRCDVELVLPYAADKSVLNTTSSSSSVSVLVRETDDPQAVECNTTEAGNSAVELAVSVSRYDFLISD